MMNFVFQLPAFGLLTRSPAPVGPKILPAYEARQHQHSTTQLNEEPKAKVEIVVWLLLIAHLITSTAYAIAVPIGETSDEPDHIAYVEILLRTGQLPTIPRDSPRYNYEAIQPPLFYLIEAGWMRLVWPNDKLLPPLKPNPKFSFANDNLTSTYLHDYRVAEAVPAYLMRLLSILMGVGALVLLWLAARMAWPEDRGAHVITLGFAALLPGMTFTSGRVSNDSLAAAVGAALLLVSVRLLKRGITVKTAAIAGVALGLGLLTKQSFLALAPIMLIVPLLSPAPNWRARFAGSGLILLVASVVGGWPFVNNWVLYGDPLANAAYLKAISDLATPLTHVPFFWLMPWYTLALFNSLWGVFGLRNVELPDLIYDFYYALCAIALFGLLYHNHTHRIERNERRIMLIAGAMLLLIYAGVAQYNTQLWSIQGRLLLPSFAALALLIGRGLSLLGTQVLPTHRTRQIAVAVLLITFASINWYALITHIVQLYYG